MEGLIQQQSQDALTPGAIRSQMHIPANLQDAYQRIVLAGMKVMFDKSTHKLMLEELDGPGTMGEKLGKGIAGLMILLVQQSNGTLPPQLIIPAALELLAHAADFLKKSGQQVSNEDFGEASQVAISEIMRQFNLDPDKVAAIGSRGVESQGQQAPQTPQAPQGAHPAPEQPAAPEQGVM